ncbi:hypothetical protein Btru_054365 [Bulinus truncatus]|nr:hypothetical protein Btru_054365 [Bulinus truncatus]
MDEQSGNNGMVRDSYELYESPKKADLIGTLVEGAVNGTVAPGSPGSMLDYRQVVNSLQKELEEKRKREIELINILRTTQNSTGPLIDAQYVNLEVSSSNDNLGESVKDAHIKYLQRQVTVLQASLYKYEGWSNRLVALTKERDEALNDLRSLKSENSILVEKNRILQMEIDTMEANYQRKLQQNQAEMENLIHQGARSNELMLSVRGNEMLLEETDRLRAENRTLKESLSRLEAENKSLKEYSMSASINSQSLGNVACSQELEYLHKVVDTLKNTVLEQRRFLLSMRSPNLSSTAKDLQSSQPSISAASQTGVEASVEKDPQRANLRRTLTAGAAIDPTVNGSPLAQQLLPKQSVNINRLVGKEETGENLVDLKGISQEMRPLIGLNIVHASTEGSRVDPLDNLKLQNSLNVTPRNSNSVFDSQKNVVQSSAESARQPTGVFNGNGYVPMYSPRHKVSQSEILSRRVAEEQSNQTFVRSKSATIAYNPEYVNTGRSMKPSPLPYLGAVKEDVSNNIGYNLKPGPSPSHPSNYEPPRLSAWETNQLLLDDNTVISSYPKENVRPQQGMLNPVTHRADANGKTNNSYSASKNSAALPPPLAHRPKSHISSLGSPHFYTNDQGEGDTGQSKDTKPTQSQTDKLCPVCNKDFSQASMEDFQTHVFRCFDDDEAPETMKPQEASRLCPMCHLTFSSSTPQAEYEKHVHGHFAEDNHAENFEILHP